MEDHTEPEDPIAWGVLRLRGRDCDETKGLTFETMPPLNRKGRAEAAQSFPPFGAPMTAAPISAFLSTLEDQTMPLMKTISG